MTARNRPALPPAALEAITMSKAKRRLLPFLAICFFVAFLDRVNVSFAALDMNTQLGLTPLVSGLGAGLSFPVTLSSFCMRPRRAAASPRLHIP